MIDATQAFANNGKMICVSPTSAYTHHAPHGLASETDADGCRWWVAQENVEDAKKSQHVTRKLAARADGKKLDTKLDDQFNSGRLYACISSRPGQCGRISGYILEGKELEFYIKKMTKRKKVPIRPTPRTKPPARGVSRWPQLYVQASPSGITCPSAQIDPTTIPRRLTRLSHRRCVRPRSARVASTGRGN